ncbi:hypothetical protein DFA_11464 [Cavenderia fasciculata]|uniref:Uncharacterized protein n=1 Tax=Cavenderia fasciculata TaxID=261658 RepID=F4QD22_CACFS|nr:uncharacterized protein DFA_11464 [Cavenderia fasciculata]EGG13703.1 hypothetical protein DFA_11464 [Cavenderia fasciculata]|eukprot:XP_004350407.1 hypothetical protein DFA_11464 [Cavenderia fasciculata]
MFQLYTLFQHVYCRREIIKLEKRVQRLEEKLNHEVLPLNLPTNIDRERLDFEKEKDKRANERDEEKDKRDNGFREKALN